jgi:lipopolysaccharide export system protein LptC
MTKANYSYWFVTLLISLAGLVLYFFTSMNTIKASNFDKSLLKNIDSMATNIQVKQFNGKGNVVTFLETPKAEHVPGKNIHLLTTPHIIVTEENKEPWEITAKNATAIRDGSKITFLKNVVIKQQNIDNTDSIYLKTDKITYFPHTKFATTENKITIKQAFSNATAIGMNAYLAENRIQLLNSTTGHYEQRHG